MFLTSISSSSYEADEKFLRRERDTLESTFGAVSHLRKSAEYEEQMTQERTVYSLKSQTTIQK